jgi:hypothetical protein
MVAALKKEDIDLVHIIGPNTGHGYHPAAKAEIDRRIDRIAAIGRQRVPERIRFTTPTLRYNRSFWVQLDGLGEHWQKASVEAALVKDRTEVQVSTKNVTALTLSFGPGDCPLSLGTRPVVTIDDTRLQAGLVRSDRSFAASFERTSAGKWQPAKPAEGLRKVPGLQGPIDDAFLDSFLIVRPTGTGTHEKVDAWVKAEMERAIKEWRRQFRGYPRVKDDRDVTEADVAAHNLILWGDPQSNSLLAKIKERLPVAWGEKALQAGNETFAPATHIPALIYPNPLNPRRYVVLNSGFTYREYDYLNNARQVPRLPDWAVLDVTTPPTTQWPGKVVAAGFFDERWRLAAR